MFCLVASQFVASQRMKPTVYYDTECGLCNTLVSWLRRRDRQGALEFKALQNASNCPVELSPDPRNWELVFEDNSGVYQRSDAVLRVLFSLGGLYRMALILFIVPRRLRDAVYLWVARHRSRK